MRHRTEGRDVQISAGEPIFRSAVFTDIPAPDYADLSIVALPQGALTDPRMWAEAIFDAASRPLWVKGGLPRARAPRPPHRSAARGSRCLHCPCRARR
ncbi:hypothetical protein GCM10009792_03400 [Microcella alkalica]